MKAMNHSTTILTCLALPWVTWGCFVGAPTGSNLPETSQEPVHFSGTQTKLQGEYTPKISMSWGTLQAEGEWKLAMEWKGSVVLQSFKEGRTKLWMPTQKPERETDVKLREIYSFSGTLTSLVAHQEKLFLLHNTAETTTLSILTPKVDGGYTQRAVATYPGEEDWSPQALQPYGNELLLFGQRKMARIDGNTQEVVLLQGELPGEFKQIRCNGTDCVALFDGHAYPMILRPTWWWTALDVVYKRPDGSDPLGSQGLPTHPKHRMLRLSNEFLLMEVDGQVYASRDIMRLPLEWVDTPQELRGLGWFGTSLALMLPHEVRVESNDKNALLELPEILQRADAKAFQLNQMQMMGVWVLLQSNDTNDGSPRFFLAQRTP